MTNQRSFNRSVIVLVVSVLAANITASAAHGAKRTDGAGADTPRLNWRPMHTAWDYGPDPAPRGPYDERITDMVLRGDRIYYLCHGQVECINTQTGHREWHREVSYGDTVEWCNLAIDDRFLYTAEKANRSNREPAVARYHLAALNLHSGEPAWERTFAETPQGVLCAASSRLLIPFDNGTLMCVDGDTGKPVWSKQVMTPTPDRMSGQDNVILQVSGQTVVLKTGASGIAAFRLTDGIALWQYPSESHLLKNEATQAMMVSDGAVYAFLYNFVGSTVDPACQMVALEVASGKRLWLRSGHGPSDSMQRMLLLGREIVGDPFSTVLAMNRTNGHTAWLGATARNEPIHYLSPLHHWQPTRHVGNENVILEVRDCATVLRGSRIKSPEHWISNTLVALNPETGREKWRWQPEDGRGIDMICSDDKRLYISDGESIRAVEDGAPAPLPTSPKSRRALAAQVVQAEFGWPYYDDGNLARRARAGNLALTLLELGSDSLPPLIEYVEHEVLERESQFLRAKLRGCYIEAWDSLAGALNIVADIGDRSCVPDLIKELDEARSPEGRGPLAEGLIKLGDPRAAEAVFRFAQSDTDRVLSRQSALYWLCRATNASLPQRRITDYLMSSLSDATAPAWLRLFARLELMNHRGKEAKRAALAAFKTGGHGLAITFDAVLSDGYLFSDGARHSGFPTHVHLMSPTRDAAATWWAAFYCDYLGDKGDLWLAQSEDGKKWSQPLFVMNLSSQCAPGGTPGVVALNCIDDKLDIRWEEYKEVAYSVKTFPHTVLIRFTDIGRDLDGDGLTNQLEKEIGAVPAPAVTNGNRIANNANRAPTSPRHKLTDEEGMFEAAVEALCQAGRTNQTGVEHSFSPIDFGGTNDPLALFAPPGSKGVNILGHPGPVLFRNPHIGAPNPYSLQYEAGLERCGIFTRPHIDIAGVMADPDWEWWDHYEPSQDPFDDGKSTANTAASAKARTWRDYFPYERSHDGNRARVGYEERVPDGGSHEAAEVHFDVEVRKIDGEWVPIECHQVYAAGAGASNHFSRTTAVPLVH